MFKTLLANPAGNAVTRQVARAKHAIAKERGKLTLRILGQSTLSTGLASLGLKAAGQPIYAGAIFTGTTLGSLITVKNPALSEAIKNCKALKASNEYKEVVARAKQIYKK